MAKDANGNVIPGTEVTEGDTSGAQERFGREYGQNAAGQQAGLADYNTFRDSGQDHETAYQSAVKKQGWAQPSTPVNQPPGSPVSPTGSMAPPPAPAATPQAIDARPDARTPAQVAPAPTYTAQTFQNTLGPMDVSQYQAPDQSGINNQQNTLLSAIMNHPETLDANTIAQMKEQQKEQALLLGKQNMGAYAQSAVGRGTLNSGQTDAFRSNNDSNINNAILSGNRATDLAAVAQNRQDQLNALTASSGIAQDQLGRSTSAYTTGLAGQTARNSANLSKAQFGLGVDQANAGQQQLQYASQKDANDAAYARAMGYAQNAQSVYGQDLSAQFGNQQQNLDMQKFLEMQDEFQKQLSFNYDQLGQNGALTTNGQILDYLGRKP